MRGGHRQQRRLALGRERDAPVPVERHGYACPLEQSLLREFAWGNMQGAAVERVAYAAFMAGVDSPAICRLAAMGGFGQNPQHVHSQITSVYSKGIKMPQVQPITIPAVDPRNDLLEVISVQTGVFHFHEWLASLAEHYTFDFECIFGSPNSKSFWESCDQCGA